MTLAEQQTGLLTVAEAATRYNIPASTIHDWIQKGKIPTTTRRGSHTRPIHIIDVADIERVIARKTP